MTDEVRLVMSGFARLSPEQQKEFANQFVEYLSMTSSEKNQYEGVELRFNVAVKAYLGPVNKPCPCCGRK